MYSPIALLLLRVELFYQLSIDSKNEIQMSDPLIKIIPIRNVIKLSDWQTSRSLEGLFA